ncbi:hypothetical protein DW355_07595 [Hylemonella gracilis]|uniref:Uncharacterized protein n=1 Tax=Hylemonella gracilis TaxID=80880 RepID=A0A4P6UJD6_9BURK|nr:hypothetical protein [Hylemonella gracilis]QBK04656.1 hypothetical protein DW355_07595 [Hylemonella gracilis]
MFSKINFKYTDATEEKIYSPELIELCYVDLENVLQRVNDPSKFLVLGTKGSGKSALASKLHLSAKPEWNRFVSIDDLEQFEFHLLEKTGGERGKAIGGALSVWQLLLLIRVLSLLLQDEHFKQLNGGVEALGRALQRHGLAPSSSLVSIVQQTSRRGAFLTFKTINAELRGETTNDTTTKLKDPAAVLGSVKELIGQCKPSQSNFRLIVDGLDHPLKDGRTNAAYLGDLINAARAINLYFASLDVDAKVIVMIRDEVLSLIPDPNLAKRVNDNGIPLKWYDNTRSPLDTPLLNVIEKRAHAAGFTEPIGNLWETWFGKYIDSKDSAAFILDNTRFLPRDLISFFRELQSIGANPPFERKQILAALANYSEWFLQELSDGLAGFTVEEVRSELPSILSELGRRFPFEDFARKLTEHGLAGKQPAEEIAKDMFNASWIGNTWKTEQGTDRFSFKHRKRNASFNRMQEIVVHNGLWKSLNLI